MRFISIAAPLIFLVFAGCAVDPAVQAAHQAKLEEMEKTTPICNGEKDCAAKWEMAQFWVSRNSEYKIQTSTNVIIETYSSPDRRIDVRVTKEPMGGGKYKIVAQVGCNYRINSCMRDELDAILDFNRQVSAATP